MSTCAADRAANGAALLDERRPGWLWDIDLSRLMLSDPCRCVLGQLWAEETEPSENPYNVGSEALGITWPDAVRYGFCEPPEDVNGFDEAPSTGSWAGLTAAWKRLIASRREREATP